MLLLALPAFAHGTIYATSSLSGSPTDPTELWSLAGGWGLLHSDDAGATWSWWCEEAIGAGTLYSAAAVGDGTVVIGSNTGLFRFTVDGTLTPMTGLPDDAQVGTVRVYGDAVLADVVSVTDVDGLYVCRDLVCTPTTLVEDGRYVESIVVDGGTAWVMTRFASTLHSMLYRSDDGATWSLVHDWDEDSESRLLLDVHGDRLWSWAQPRDPEALPWLETSADGGVTTTQSYLSTNPTSEIPGMAEVDGVEVLSDNLGNTFESDDEGATWTDHTDILPLIRCVAYIDGATWICADHFTDGFDFATLDAPDAWTAHGCMDTAAVGDALCESYHDAYLDAGAYGGGECDASYSPPVAEAPGGCGCGGGADSAGVAGLWGLGVLRGWRRRREAARTPTASACPTGTRGPGGPPSSRRRWR